MLFSSLVRASSELFSHLNPRGKIFCKHDCIAMFKSLSQHHVLHFLFRSNSQNTASWMSLTAILLLTLPTASVLGSRRFFHDAFSSTRLASQKAFSAAPWPLAGMAGASLLSSADNPPVDELDLLWSSSSLWVLCSLRHFVTASWFLVWAANWLLSFSDWQTFSGARVEQTVESPSVFPGAYRGRITAAKGGAREHPCKR